MALFEIFPYTNLHELNLDWIIKIAKDFLEQYTQIQKIIEQGKTDITELTDTGLQQLTDKKDELENLLQEWYRTHSDDIETQLAQALRDIASQLNSALQDIDAQENSSIASIREYVSQVVNNIPADYSALAAMVQSLNNKTPLTNYSQVSGQYVNYTNGAFSVLGDNIRTNYISVKGYTAITLVVNGWGDNRGFAYYDASFNFIRGVQYPSGLNTITDEVPNTAQFVALTLPFVSCNFTNDMSNWNYFKQEILHDNNIRELTPSFTSGNYINSENGNFSVIGDAKRTDLLNRDYYDVIYLYVRGFNDVRGIAFYDENRNFIVGYPYTGTGMNLYKFTFPHNSRYFAFTGYNLIENEKYYLSRTDNALKKAQVAYNHTAYIPEMHFTENNYINFSNGARGVLTGNYASNFIDISNIEQVIISERGSGDNRGYAYYDKNGLYLNGVSYQQGYNSYIINPTSEMKFLAVTKTTDAFELYIIPKQENKTDTGNPLGMFKNIAGCGDSYTACVLYNTAGTSLGEHEYASWISNIGRQEGIDAFIYAHGGATTDSYLSLEDCLPKLLNETPKDLYILNLGINDSGYGVTLGTITDIHEDYTVNPNTFYGNYGRIIGMIKAHAPNAKIIISKILYTVSATQEPTNAYRYSSTAIEEIADHFGIPYIETLDSTYLKSYEYANNKYGGHPTAVQQAQIAEAMKELLNKCITENYSYFADYVASN